MTLNRTTVHSWAQEPPGSLWFVAISPGSGGDAPEPNPPSVTGAIRVRRGVRGALLEMKHDGSAPRKTRIPPFIRFLCCPVELIAVAMEMLADRLLE